jgi:hypothetical protein
MALGLTPYVRRRRKEWLKLSFMHLLGGALAGLALASTVWSSLMPVRALVHGHETPIALGAFLLAAISDASLVVTKGVERQVPQAWLPRFGGMKAFFLYGFTLGLGFVTKVNNWLLWALVIVIALIGPFLAAAGVGVVFGITRAATAVVISLSATRLSLVWRRAGGPVALRRAAAAGAAALVLGYASFVNVI